MRYLLALLLCLNTAIFAWSIVGSLGVIAEWSDVLYLIRDVDVSESVRSELECVVLRGHRDWLGVRWLSGIAAFITLVVLALAWPRRNKGPMA